uniref:Uncharacterized protein n=1 Tax=Arundo donax TaxID=35708 RepID=A0A0A9FN06_ARUDO
MATYTKNLKSHSPSIHSAPLALNITKSRNTRNMAPEKKIKSNFKQLKLMVGAEQKVIMVASDEARRWVRKTR